MTIQSKIATVLLAGFVVALAAPAVSGEVSGTLITAAEKEIIKRYFGTRDRTTQDATQAGSIATRSTGGKPGKSQDKGKGKGRAQGKGKKQMPRGIAKKLERGGTLPPGIEKTRMPADLARELPRRPADQELTIVEDNVVLVERTTRRILDIFAGAAR